MSNVSSSGWIPAVVESIAERSQIHHLGEEHVDQILSWLGGKEGGPQTALSEAFSWRSIDEDSAKQMTLKALDSYLFAGPTNNPFFILGLEANADRNKVKTRYRKLMRIYHPDISNFDEKLSARRSESINIALSEINEFYDAQEAAPHQSTQNYIHSLYKEEHSARRSESARVRRSLGSSRRFMKRFFVAGSIIFLLFIGLLYLGSYDDSEPEIAVRFDDGVSNSNLDATQNDSGPGNEEQGAIISKNTASDVQDQETIPPNASSTDTAVLTASSDLEENTIAGSNSLPDQPEEVEIGTIEEQKEVQSPAELELVGNAEVVSQIRVDESKDIGEILVDRETSGAVLVKGEQQLGDISVDGSQQIDLPLETPPLSVEVAVEEVKEEVMEGQVGNDEMSHSGVSQVSKSEPNEIQEDSFIDLIPPATDSWKIPFDIKMQTQIPAQVSTEGAGNQAFGEVDEQLRKALQFVSSKDHHELLRKPRIREKFLSRKALVNYVDGMRLSDIEKVSKGIAEQAIINGSTQSRQSLIMDRKELFEDTGSIKYRVEIRDWWYIGQNTIEVETKADIEYRYKEGGTESYVGALNYYVFVDVTTGRIIKISQ